MLYGIYSIYDVAMKCYAQPFYQANDDVAKRSFKMAINDPSAPNLFHVREDLELWRICFFDDRCGQIFYTDGSEKLPIAVESPVRIIGRGEAVIRKEENDNDL